MKNIHRFLICIAALTLASVASANHLKTANHLSETVLPNMQATPVTTALPTEKSMLETSMMNQTDKSQNASSERELIVLVGDSTVTGKSGDKDQAGWGWALQQWTTDDIEVINTAVGGRSSRSFRSEGRWDDALKLTPDWIFIQFGHNDQKGKGPERESAPETDYRDHLRRYIQEAREHGAQPILVTPVCRRTYSADGTLRDSLAPYAESVRIVAQEMQVPHIDLHNYSLNQLAQITDKEAIQRFSPEGTTDRTHFSLSASRIVAQWVLNLLEVEVPELTSHFIRPNVVLNQE